MNWENCSGKKDGELCKIEVGLQKLRRKPKFFCRSQTKLRYLIFF